MLLSQQSGWLVLRCARFFLESRGQTLRLNFSEQEGKRKSGPRVKREPKQQRTKGAKTQDAG